MYRALLLSICMVIAAILPSISSEAKDSNVVKLASYDLGEHWADADQAVADIYTALGKEVILQPMSLVRGVRAVCTHQVDGAVIRGAILIKKYCPNVLVSDEPIIYADLHPITINPDVKVLTPSDYAQYRVAVIRAAEPFVAAAYKENSFTANSFNDGVRMLIADRVDILIGSYPDAFHIYKRITNKVNMIVAGPPVKKIPLYHIVNAEEKKLFKKVNAEINARTKAGKLPLSLDFQALSAN